LNFLFRIDMDGVIQEVVTLPNELNDIQLRFGFEGVATQGPHLIVAMQRAWGDETNPRLGIYNTEDRSWKFVFYPLEDPVSQNGGWVGLSEISPLDDGKFLILERDNQGGPDAAIKMICEIDLGDLDELEDGITVSKTLFLDLVPDLEAQGGLIPEKLEGLAVTSEGSVWIVNDNDGVDDNSGETQLLNLGRILERSASATSTEDLDTTCGEIKRAYNANECCGMPDKPFSFSPARMLSSRPMDIKEEAFASVQSAFDAAATMAEKSKLATDLHRLLEAHLK